MQLNSRNSSIIRSQTQSHQFPISTLTSVRASQQKLKDRSFNLNQDAKQFYTSAMVQSTRDLQKVQHLQPSMSQKKIKRGSKTTLNDPQFLRSGNEALVDKQNQENIPVSEYIDIEDCSPTTVRRQQPSPLREQKDNSNEQPSWLEQSMSSLIKAKAKYHEAQIYLQMSESKMKPQGGANEILSKRPLSNVNSTSLVKSQSSNRLGDCGNTFNSINYKSKSKPPVSRNNQKVDTSHTNTNSTMSTSFVENRSIQTNRKSMGGCGSISSQATADAKADMISHGLKEKSQIITSKTEQLTVKQTEKKQIQIVIAKIKKDVIQMQKQVNQVNNCNKQTETDCMTLSKLVVQKREKSAVSQKEIAKLKKEIKQIEKEVDTFKQNRAEFETEIQAEQVLSVSVHELIGAYRKQIIEVRKEKEKLQIAVKSSIKIIEMLDKRRNVLDGDSTKLYLDFKDALDQDKQITINPYS